MNSMSELSIVNGSRGKKHTKSLEFLSGAPKIIPGINIQWPWSRLILSGEKTVETRHYPIPQKYIGQPLAIIETPGPKKEGSPRRSQIIGVVVFSTCFAYTSENKWKSDKRRHLVPGNHAQFSFDKEKTKWGWEIESVHTLKKPIRPPKKRGLLYTTQCRVTES
jgi:hypothetical protein